MSTDVAEYRRLREQLHTLRRAILAAWNALEQVGTNTDRALNNAEARDWLDRIGVLLEGATRLTEAPIGRLDAVLEAHAVDGECGHCGRKGRRKRSPPQRRTR